MENLTPEQKAANFKNEVLDTANNAVETKATEIKTELNETLESLKSDSKENFQSMQKSIDELAAKSANTEVFGISKKRTEFEESFEKAATDYKSGRTAQMEVSTKTFTPTASSSTLVPSSYNQESAIKYNPNYKVQIRDVISTMTDNENGSIIWNRQTNDESSNRATTGREGDAAAAKAFGAAAAQTTIEMQRQESTFRTLTAFYTMPEEYFNDITRFESFISTRLMGNLMDLESRQLLNGTGSGQNFNGINTFGQTIGTDTLLGGWANSIDNANRFDAIIALSSILAQEDFAADTVVLNPFDYYQMSLIKTTGTASNGDYVLTTALDSNGLISTYFNGLRIVKSNAQAANTFTVIDSQAFEYVVREGVSLEFDRNANDFQTNSISVRAQLRGNIADWLPTAVKVGAFTGTAGVITLLETP